MEKGLQLHGDSLDYSIDQRASHATLENTYSGKAQHILNIIYSFLQTDPPATSFRPLC